MTIERRNPPRKDLSNDPLAGLLARVIGFFKDENREQITLRELEMKAARISKRVAEHVLQHGEQPQSGWYQLEIVTPDGSQLELKVADVNGHGRKLTKIIRGGNQNDRLSVKLLLPVADDGSHFSREWSEQGVREAEWSLPKDRLDWLRSYRNQLDMNEGGAEGWYTYHHSYTIGETVSQREVVEAHQRYLELINEVQRMLAN